MNLRLLPTVAACAIVSTASSIAGELDDFLRSNAAKFPLIKLERGEEEPFAKVHTLPGPAEALPFKDRFYSGYRFTVPDWLDGSVLWIFSIKGPEEEAEKPFSWFILSEEDDGSKFQLSRSRWATDHRFPFFKKQFPGFESFYEQYFGMDQLKKSKNYIVWFAFTEKERPEVRFALTVRSTKGLREYGTLPTGISSRGPGTSINLANAPKARPPRQMAKEAAEIYKKSGAAAARAFLEKEFEAFLKTGEPFYDFYVGVWREAQTGGGRVEAEWAAEAFGWLQEKCLAIGAVDSAEELVANTAGSMINANRYGAARQSLAPFFTAMGRRSVSLDPSLLKDLGPGLTLLPEVRKRKIPVRSVRPMLSIEPDGWVNATAAFPDSFDKNLQSYANLEAQAGQWKKALEQYLWICSWAEFMYGKEGFEIEEGWFSARQALAETLQNLGLNEAADLEFETILTKDWTDIYRGRTLNVAKSSRIEIKIDQGQAQESMLAELDALVEEAKKNPYSNRLSWERIEITKAKCLASLGRTEEADKLLSDLIKGKNRHALITRIGIRLEANRLENLEQELVTVLESSREWGKKIEEAKIYSLYADFLEKSGRLEESLAMRREAIRLMKGFDLFAFLPVELARLSTSLSRCGDTSSAKLAAAEAQALVTKPERIPDRIAKQVNSIIEAASSLKPASAETKKVFVDLQPQHAVVVPLEGNPVRGRLTLANPSTQAVEGTLGFDGMPVDVSFDAASGEALAKLGTGGALDRVNKLRIDPGSYVQIQLSADAKNPPKGELTVWWSSPGQDDRKSLWTFDTAEEGVSSAVIDAGEFKRNAFYGVPIHHHYQNASGTLATLRAVTSVPARVEIYDAADKPVSVDMNGNGNFTESGDSIFTDGDADGNPDLTMEAGEAILRLQVFPIGEIPPDGMKVSVEALVDGKWLPFSEDRIVP
ncbi:tetratricopeptide repeat protein [Luteolibacter luteus]|uniref:Tetratricopeptide repeat protein n=1 Tax=Luteolibacter luteus TaxID=2728835 RepID=A0A858RMB8_9BACT|nr:hypothetical protein [Luteolibacter luteus]QJE98127.1 hypothetical protein HHL09_20845 [Luteolibacter luteus]